MQQNVNIQQLNYQLDIFCDLIDNELRNASHVITNLHAGELDDVLGRYKKVQFPLQVDRSRIGAKKI